MSNITFSSVTSERLAWSFKVQMENKSLDTRTLHKYAVVFWNICIKNGLMDCPFPEYLVKYVRG